ncbi:hypothetical protein ACQHGV_05330 [Sphingomonas pseudosanguinis]|uniref:hypothetical protein n=1 Tax=Sphingomonas pseudosanguinis TaxID=413712 RepID=UPI003F874F76
MVDPNDPKKPRPPRRRVSPKSTAGATPRKRPAAKPPEVEAPPVETGEQDGTAAPKPAAKPKAPPKPRSTKRTAPRKAPPRKPAPIKPAPAPALGKHGLDRVGGKWGVASILGSLAAFAGVTAALLSLRGSSARRDDDGERQGD